MRRDSDQVVLDVDAREPPRRGLSPREQNTYVRSRNQRPHMDHTRQQPGCLIRTPGLEVRGSSIWASSDHGGRFAQAGGSSGGPHEEALNRCYGLRQNGDVSDCVMYPRTNEWTRRREDEVTGWNARTDIARDSAHRPLVRDERYPAGRYFRTWGGYGDSGFMGLHTPQMSYPSTGYYPPDTRTLYPHDYEEDGVRESGHHESPLNDNVSNGIRSTSVDNVRRLSISNRKADNRLDSQSMEDPYCDRLERHDPISEVERVHGRAAIHGQYRPLEIQGIELAGRNSIRELSSDFPQPLRDGDVTRASLAHRPAAEDSFAERSIVRQSDHREWGYTGHSHIPCISEQRGADVTRSSGRDDDPQGRAFYQPSITSGEERVQAGCSSSGPRSSRAIVIFSPTPIGSSLQFADNRRDSRCDPGSGEEADVTLEARRDGAGVLDDMKKIDRPGFVQNLEGMPGSRKFSSEASPRLVPASTIGQTRNGTIPSRMRSRGSESRSAYGATFADAKGSLQVPPVARSPSPEDDVQNQLLKGVGATCQNYQKSPGPGIVNEHGQKCTSDVPESKAVQGLASEQPRRLTRRSSEYAEVSQAGRRDSRGPDSLGEKRQLHTFRYSESKKHKIGSVHGNGRSNESASPEIVRKTTREPSMLGGTKQLSNSECPASNVVNIDVDEAAAPQTEDRTEDLSQLSLNWHASIPYNSEDVRSRISRFTELAADLRTVNIGFSGMEAKHFEEVIPHLARLSTLSILQAENNKLEYIPENFEVLCKTHILESIVLRSNCLTDFPNVLLSCTRLTFLNLSRNRLTSVPLGLAKLEYVRCLELSHNLLTSLPGPGFGTMKNLQVLKLDNNHLSALPDDFGESNSSLTVLDISQNAEFGGGLPVPVRNLSTQLEDLVMQGTGIMSKLPRKYLKATAAELINLMAGASEADVLRRIETSKLDARRTRRQVSVPSHEIVPENPDVTKPKDANVKAIDDISEGR